jgi:hypothetical protein
MSMKRCQAFLLATLFTLSTFTGIGCDEEVPFVIPPPLSARFDYSVPARFEIPQPLSSEGSYEAYVNGPLHPDRWQVEFDACGSTGTVVSYSWSVDGVSVGSETTCRGFTYDFPGEGSYSVTLVVEDKKGDQASQTAPVQVRDLLIFGVGDSYGSGEGNPDVPISIGALNEIAALRAELEEAAAGLDAVATGDPSRRQAAAAAYEAAEAGLADALVIAGAQWQNRRCHRSAHSGQVRAARLLEEGDPHTSVTFVHLACSGARVHTGLLGEYLGIEEDGPPLAPQIDRVRELADGHEIDALLISIGGNDVNFANVVESCILGERCYENPAAPDPTLQVMIAVVCLVAEPFTDDCTDYLNSLLFQPDALDAKTLFDLHASAQDVNGQDIREDGNDDLPDNYFALARDIVQSLRMNPARVYLTEYPDVTHNEFGQYCGWPTPPTPASVFRQLPGVSQPEMLWADTYVSAQLRATMQTAANQHGWRLVAGISDRFRLHGYCSTNNWLVRLHNSFLIQGDANGIAHPNVAGHAAYAAEIANAIAP